MFKGALAVLFLVIQEFFLHTFDYIVLFFTSFVLVLKTIAIAIIGGFTDYMLKRKQSGEDFSFKKSFFHCFIAGFTGYLSQKLCSGFNVGADLTAFLIGISGFAGTRMLSFFEKLSQTIFEKISQLEVEVKFGKKNGKDDTENKEDKNI